MQVLKESFKLYCAINDGIINLADMCFEMPKHDAVKALNIYKRAGQQANPLADFYGFCRTLDLARTFHFSYIETVEEYMKKHLRRVQGQASDWNTLRQKKNQKS